MLGFGAIAALAIADDGLDDGSSTPRADHVSVTGGNRVNSAKSGGSRLGTAIRGTSRIRIR